MRTLPPLLLSVLVLLALAAPAALAAQEASAGAGVPAVTLPDMDSEVNAVLPPAPSAPLPPLQPVPEPAVEPPLPQAGELKIPESAYRTEPAAQADTGGQGSRSLTEARVGAGLWNGLGSQLSVYRPYGDAALNLDFSHDTVDGFAFQEAGQGFHRRDTALSARFRTLLGKREAWALSASFHDAATGLQGQSPDFFGVNHRYLEAATSYGRPLGPLDLLVSLGATHTDRSLELATDTPAAGTLGFQELILSPELGVSWKRGDFSLELELNYRFRALLGLDSGTLPAGKLAHLALAALSGSFDNSGALALGGKVAYAWSSSLGHLVPFELSTDLGISTWAALSLDGGLAVDQRSLTEAWKENPYLDIGTSLQADDGRWFARGGLELYPAHAVTVNVKGSWAMSLPNSGRLVPVAPASANRRLYGFTVEAYDLLDTELGLRWRLDGAELGSLILGAAWKAAWFDPSVLGESQFIGADVEYQGPANAFGAAASVDFAMRSGAFIVPLLDANGFLKLGADFSLVLEIRDILMAFQGTTGRVRYAPYLEDGFGATASLKLAL